MKPEALRGRVLVAGAQDRLRASLLHVHLTFEHGHPRALHPRADGEDGPRDGDRAVGGGHVKVAAVALGRLHEHTAALEMDGGVTAARAHR
jgi:hypothetical protein